MIMGILTECGFYIYMIVSVLRKCAYVRFAEIGAKSPVLAKPNIGVLFNIADNRCFTQMGKC